MKERNNHENIAVDDVENIPITSEVIEKPKRNWKIWKKDKSQDGQPRVRRIKTNDLSESSKKSMLTRVISAIVGLAIIIPAIFIGDWIYFGVVSVALVFACYEILGCTNKRTIVTVLVYFIFVALITYWPIFRMMVPPNVPEIYSIGYYYKEICLPILVVIGGSFLVFFLTVVYKDFTVQDACYLIAMAIIVGLGFQCLFYLRYYPNNYPSVPNFNDWQFTAENTVKPSLLLIFVIFSTFMTDTGAYFVGVFFGKNKINERISPHKTWEGFVGGIVISFLFSSALGLTLASITGADGASWSIHPNITLQEQWYLILILSLLIPLFATLGDFVFSSIKRYWGIKDYGILIPGHGGVLDRLDSIIFAVIITSIFIHMLSVIKVGEAFDWSKFLV